MTPENEENISKSAKIVLKIRSCKEVSYSHTYPNYSTPNPAERSWKWL